MHLTRKEIPEIVSLEIPAFETASRRAFSVAVIQSKGSCSDQPGRGDELDKLADPDPITAPCRVRTHFTADVPRSIPSAAVIQNVSPEANA